MKAYKCSTDVQPSSPLKALKFKISSPEQSERLQKVLFELGYEWYCGYTIKFTDSPYLYVVNGVYTEITYGDSEEEFNTSDYKLKDTDKFISKYSKKAVKKDKWISAEDKLPKLGVDYLVYNNSFLIAFQTSDRKWYSYDPKGYVSDVTHYRKLPKGPKD